MNKEVLTQQEQMLEKINNVYAMLDDVFALLEREEVIKYVQEKPMLTEHMGHIENKVLALRDNLASKL